MAPQPRLVPDPAAVLVLAAWLLDQAWTSGYAHAHTGTAIVSIAAGGAVLAALLHFTHILVAQERPLPPAPRSGPVALLVLSVPLLVTYLPAAAWLDRADAVSMAMCVMMVAAAIGRRHRVMLGWLGLAAAVQLAALAIAPLVVALLIRRRVSMREWPVALAIWLAARWLTIGPSADSSQSSIGIPSIPNLVALVDLLPTQATMPLTALALVAAVGLAFAYTARVSVAALSTRSLIECAALCPLIVVGLLPGADASSFLLAELLALVVAITWPDRRSIATAAVLMAGSALAAVGAAVDTPAYAALGAICTLAAGVSLARPLRIAPANDNWRPARLPA